MILHAFIFFICHIDLLVITEPGRVSELVAIGTTTNMSVNWKAASGQVDYYSVQLYRGSQLQGNQTLLYNTTLNVLFTHLNPATLYDVQVLTMSGPLNNRVTASNATCELL